MESNSDIDEEVREDEETDKRVSKEGVAPNNPDEKINIKICSDEEIAKLTGQKKKLGDQLLEFEKKYQQILANKEEQKKNSKKQISEPEYSEEELRVKQELEETFRSVVKLQKQAESLRTKTLLNSQNQEKFYQLELKLVAKDKELQSALSENSQLEKNYAKLQAELEEAKSLSDKNERIENLSKEIKESKMKLRELIVKEKAQAEVSQKTTDCYVLVNKLYRDLCEKYGLDPRKSPAEMEQTINKAQSLPKITKKGGSSVRASMLRSSLKASRMPNKESPEDPANFTEKDYSEENYRLIYNEYKSLVESFKEQSASHGEAPKEAKEVKELEAEIEALVKTVQEKEKLVHIANARLNELQRLQKMSKKYSKKKPERIKTENTKEEESPNAGTGEEQKEEPSEARAREEEKHILLGTGKGAQCLQGDQSIDNENPQLIKLAYSWSSEEQKILSIQAHYLLDSGEIKLGSLMGEENEKSEQKESNLPSDEGIQQIFCATIDKFICYMKLTTTEKKIIEIGAEDIPETAEKKEITLSYPRALGVIFPAFSGVTDGGLTLLKIGKKR